jgi:protein SCO1/2
MVVRHRRSVAIAVAFVAIGAVGLGAAFAGPRDGPTLERAAPKHSAPPLAFHGTRIPAGKEAPDFRLRTESGEAVRLSAQKGKLVLLAFLYTHCTDVCPRIAMQLDDVTRGLGARADKVRVLAVSVDPVGDTRQAARRYITTHRLGPEFHWLLGTRQELWPVWRAYNVAVSPTQSGDSIAHTAPVLLLDMQGRPRVYYQEPQSSKAIAFDLRLLLDGASRRSG